MCHCILRLTLVLVVVAMMIQPSTAAWFGQPREDSVTTFKRDAARTWQSGKVVGKEKLNQAKDVSKVKYEQAKKNLGKASVEAKKKGRKVATEGRGLAKDVQKRVGRMVMDK